MVAQFGLYYKNNGQNMKSLTTQMFKKGQTDELFTRINTTETQKDRAYVTSTRVTQAFQKDFVPLGATKFTPATIDLFHTMVDVQEDPDDFDETWLGFLEDMNLDRSKWPIIRWWLENIIIPQHTQDMEVDEAFAGIRLDSGPIVPGTATPSGETLDGVNIVRKRGIAASGVNKITPIVTGALSTDAVTFVTQMETFIKAVDPDLRRKLQTLVMSAAKRNLFREGMRTKYNVNYEMTKDLTKFMDYPITITGLDNMDGSDVIWSSPKTNCACLIKKGKNRSKFRLYPQDKRVRASSDYYKGYGWWILPWVVTNDQDIVIV